MIYIINAESLGYKIGPFYSIDAAIKYCDTDDDLCRSMIELLQAPAY